MSFLVNAAFPIYVRWRTTRMLKIRFMRLHGANVQCRVANSSNWQVKRAILYITVYYDHSDVLPPPSNNKGCKKAAFITNNHVTDLVEDRIIWSVARESIDRMEIDIFPGEEQVFAPFQIFDDYVEVPSELGFASDDCKCRVFLKKKEYKGVLKIVSESTWSKEFAFNFNPNRPDDLLKIECKCCG